MIQTFYRPIVVFFSLATIVNTYAFDCSVIYDEYDSLMHKEFLISPDNYVATVSGEISHDDFNATQRGKLHLRNDRPDKGVGIVFTNNKLYGKFVFDWSDHQRIIVEDIIIYNRVDDGYAPVHHWNLTMNHGDQIDLDSGRVYTGTNLPEEELLRADLQLSSESLSNPVLESINEARVFFPMSSLCD